MNNKSWRTKEWKDKRIIFLKDKICEKCKKEPATVVQHKWHPSPYFLIHKTIGLHIIYKKIINGEEILPEEMILQSEIEGYVGIGVNVDFIIQKRHIDLNKFKVKCCPYCKRKSQIRKKFTLYPYRCSWCKKEVEPSEYLDYQALYKYINTYAIISNYMKEMYKKYEEQIKILAKEEYDRQSKRYNSFIDAIPYCKKCAFIEDKTDLILCQKCKSKYHSKMYDCCFNCLPEDKKNKILKQNELDKLDENEYEEYEKETDEIVDTIDKNE